MTTAIKDFDQLNASQKLRLVDEILSSLADLPMSTRLRRELELRDREMDAEGGVAWSIVKKKMTIK